MNSFIVSVLSFATPFLATFIFSKISPNKAAKLFAKLIAKLTSNPSNQNKIENSLGDFLISLGKSIRDIHPDSKSEQVKSEQTKSEGEQQVTKEETKEETKDSSQINLNPPDEVIKEKEEKNNGRYN